MTQEEQDQILGRLTRELGETRKRIAALEAKVTEASEYLISAGNVLCELGRRQITLDIEFLQKLDRQVLLETINELQAERKNAERLNDQVLERS